MEKFIKEEQLISQPIDKIDKNLRHIFGLLMERDWKTAATLIRAMSTDGSAEVKQLAGGFGELLDFLKVMSAGKELKASVRRLDNIILDDGLAKLLPEPSDEEFEELVADIQEKGILAPLIVQERDEGLILVDGYTRYRIAKDLGIGRVPVVSAAPNIDPRILAIAINLVRRHMTRDARTKFIASIPVPKAGRPKKDEITIKNKDLVSSLGVSERTLQRARKPKTPTNDGVSRPKKRIPKICTPPDKEEGPIEVGSWINLKDLDMFDKVGYLKGIGYAIDFTKDQIDIDFLVKTVDKGMKELLRAIKDADLESKVGKYRMTVSFEARKREERIKED